MAMLAAPGPYDPTAKTYFDVMPMDDYTPAQADSFLREYNHWLMQILAIHEAVPGHYVQLLYANKSPSRIKAIFGNSAMIEVRSEEHTTEVKSLLRTSYSVF